MWRADEQFFFHHHQEGERECCSIRAHGVDAAMHEIQDEETSGADAKGLIDAAKNELVGGPRNGSKNACE